AEDGIRDFHVTGVQTCALPIYLEITEATPAQIEQAGATTVPAHLLYDIVRKLSDGSEVLLATSADGSSMTVASGRSKFSLQCLRSEERRVGRADRAMRERDD